MADKYTVVADSVALSAATVKTVLQVATPGSARLRLCELHVGFQGVTATDVPVLVELVRQTSAGTSTAVTPVALDSAAPTSLATAGFNFTVEPSGPTVLGTWRLTPNGGLLVIPFYGDEQPVVAINSWLGIRCNAAAAVSVNAQMTYHI